MTEGNANYINNEKSINTLAMFGKSSRFPTKAKK
jgi:hypothetical protein